MCASRRQPRRWLVRASQGLPRARWQYFASGLGPLGSPRLRIHRGTTGCASLTGALAPAVALIMGSDFGWPFCTRLRCMSPLENSQLRFVRLFQYQSDVGRIQPIRLPGSDPRRPSRRLVRRFAGSPREQPFTLALRRQLLQPSQRPLQHSRYSSLASNRSNTSGAKSKMPRTCVTRPRETSSRRANSDLDSLCSRIDNCHSRAKLTGFGRGRIGSMRGRAKP